MSARGAGRRGRQRERPRGAATSVPPWVGQRTRARGSPSAKQQGHSLDACVERRKSEGTRTHAAQRGTGARQSGQNSRGRQAWSGGRSHAEHTAQKRRQVSAQRTRHGAQAPQATTTGSGGTFAVKMPSACRTRPALPRPPAPCSPTATPTWPSGSCCERARGFPRARCASRWAARHRPAPARRRRTPCARGGSRSAGGSGAASAPTETWRAQCRPPVAVRSSLRRAAVRERSAAVGRGGGAAEECVRAAVAGTAAACLLTAVSCWKLEGVSNTHRPRGRPSPCVRQLRTRERETLQKTCDERSGASPPQASPSYTHTHPAAEVACRLLSNPYTGASGHTIVRGRT